MPPVSVFAKGTTFTRIGMARALSGIDNLDVMEIASRAWGPGSQPALALRAAVSAASTTDVGAGAELAPLRVAGEEFVAAMRPATILGKMAGSYRSVPLGIRVPRATSGSSVSWVGAKSPAPLSSMAFDTITLPPLKVSGIISSTRELADLSTPGVEGVVRADLIAGAAAFVDQALIDPALAGETGVSPASITYGAPSVASVGVTVSAMSQDLKSLVGLLVDAGVNLIAPFFVTHPRVATAMAFSERDGGPAFPSLGPRGGEIAGIPVLTSASVPATATGGDSPAGAYTSSVILLDAADLLVGMDGAATISSTKNALLQMESSPDSPGTASTVEVSLWQRNLIAWKVTLPLNFAMRRGGSCAVLTGVNY